MKRKPTKPSTYSNVNKNSKNTKTKQHTKATAIMLKKIQVSVEIDKFMA